MDAAVRVVCVVLLALILLAMWAWWLRCRELERRRRVEDANRPYRIARLERELGIGPEPEPEPVRGAVEQHRFEAERIETLCGEVIDVLPVAFDRDYRFDAAPPMLSDPRIEGWMRR